MPAVPVPEDASVSELWRRLEDHKSDTEKRFEGLHNHIDRRFDETMKAMKEISFVPRAEFEYKHNALRTELLSVIKGVADDLRDAKERDTWRSRMFVAALVSGVVSIIVAVLVLGIQLAAST